MSNRATQRIFRVAVQNRRQEVAQQLASCGLESRPLRLLRGESAVYFDQGRSRRIRLALEKLGPVFSAFGLYMSARPDLLAVSDCLELAGIRDMAEATPIDLVRELLHDELDRLPEQIFSAFEQQPFESRFLFQSHYARLQDGADVIVKIIHPETVGQLPYDMDLLPLLKDSFAGCGVTGSAFKSATADFCHTLQRQRDFVHESRAYEALAQDEGDYDGLRAPQLLTSLTRSKVLVIEKPNGLTLSDAMSVLRERGSDDESQALLASIGMERNELARFLCEVWLRQALFGRSFPIEPRPENILILPSKQVVFNGGAFGTLPSNTQTNLWDYLLAAANDNSDKACTSLLIELRKERVGTEDVRHRFRQAMPFRDGGWETSGDRHSLSELLFVQWRFATQCGYTPLMHLPAFYRGLFGIADVARRIAPRIDPLAEGMRDLRLLNGLTEFSHMVTQERFAEQMDKYTSMVMDMPQTFDEALTSMSEGQARLKIEAAYSANQLRAGSSSTVLTALLLVLAAIVLLSRYLTASPGAGVWANRIIAISFIIFGALLLRAMSRAH